MQNHRKRDDNLVLFQIEFKLYQIILNYSIIVSYF